jgi:8-oxo-dGTP pyrophosphatase MutT (NUDIX family)
MLPDISKVSQIIKLYSEKFSSASVQSVHEFVNTCNEQDELYKRKNFNGHITASALIINSRQEMLLVLHAVFNRYMPPGGHVEPDEDSSLMQGAMREAIEETGIGADDIQYLPADASHPEVPFDINSHPIPENNKKNEPAHVHHDFRYLFRYTGNGQINPDPEETKGAKWVGKDELSHVSDMGEVAMKISW